MEWINGFGCAADGLLTYVQGVGFKPSSNPATSASTADFGVGVFLMACAETAKLASGSVPAVSNFDIVDLRATDKNRILLRFNQEIEDVSALSISNYEINNAVKVKRIEKEKPDRLYWLPAICFLQITD